MIPAIFSLTMGLIIGYMGQRSRMCFIGGIRDYIIVKDTYLVKGFLGFLLTAIVMFMILNSFGVYLKDYPWYNKKPEMMSLTDYAREKGLAYAVCDMPAEAVLGYPKEVKGINIGERTLSYVAIFSILGGLSIGFFSTIANGCPFRQHVMAASGNKSAGIYLLGFYLGIIVFQYFIYDYIKGITG